MGADSRIQWCDHTFNPWEGCTKVSPGCAHCYAEARNARWAGGTAPNWGKGAPRRLTSDGNWKLPLKWNREAGDTRPRVFCASLADWLDEEVPLDWLSELLELIQRTRNLDWLLLTKRPENFTSRLKQIADDNRFADGDATHIGAWIDAWLDGYPPDNVAVGVTVEDMVRAARLDSWIEIPARRRFISAEPLLEEVDFALRNWVDGETSRFAVHQIIVGGESGPGARPFDLSWAKLIIEDAATAGVPCFVKQLGAAPISSGARLKLSDRKGGDMAEWPEWLRVREEMRA